MGLDACFLKKRLFKNTDIHIEDLIRDIHFSTNKNLQKQIFKLKNICDITNEDFEYNLTRAIEYYIGNNSQSYGVILYARTSSSNNKELLENQAKRLEAYTIAKGYKIKQIVKEFGSGLNDNRKQLSKILKDNKYDKIIVEHKDRLTRFGFNYIQLLTGNRIEVINESKEEDEDITQDLISIIHCFSARIYGLRRSKRLKLKVKDAIKEIEKES